jgi:uncharacterized damage-inducible protein DinB
LTEFHWIDLAAAAYTQDTYLRQVAENCPMKARYHMFAGYNAWCNERLFAAAATLSDADYRADRGAFFKSVHGTLNHLLVADRIWMKRFTGVGEKPPSLDAILYDDFEALRAARQSQDTLIGRYIDRLSETISTGRSTTAPWSIHRPSSRRWRQRSTISSTTRPIIAARPMPCSRPSSAMTPRRRST